MPQSVDLHRLSIMVSGAIVYLIDILDYIHGDPDFEPDELEDGDSDQNTVRPRERNKVPPRTVRRRA